MTNDLIRNYLSSIQKRYSTGLTTEHSFRGDLQQFLSKLAECHPQKRNDDIFVTNEPKRTECGAPDYVITQGKIPIGFIEAKDLGANLTDRKYDEQFDRYKSALENLVFTNYLDFHFYKIGKQTGVVSLGRLEKGKIVPIESNFVSFVDLVKDFFSFSGQTIRSASELAKLMADKARLMQTVIEKTLLDKNNSNSDGTLREQLTAFRDILIHDLDEKQFSDIYSQTITYGMFAASLHDQTLKTFSRQEAATLIPKSNPFLRKFFQYIAGYDLDDRITWIVDSLAEVFQRVNIVALLREFQKWDHHSDPMIHFYETFLAEYDSGLRSDRGVWYTPYPVVRFITQSVDEILQKDFHLENGLADHSKITVSIPNATSRGSIKESIHRVQILDPATGTGTFLAEIVNQIHRKFEGKEGIWNSYVTDHLLPRLNGFEILMAPYAMAHIKLDMVLTETGFVKNKDQRFKIYLTNSLEEHHPDTGTLFAQWLSNEANEANRLKRDVPAMVVIGNPPYRGSSMNKGKWIQDKIGDYKKGLKEKKLNLDDDYIKFIRYGEYLMEKSGEGILAYISNNSFLDGLTHRQMRKHLMETFDEIYILNLHGNANIKETSPDGKPDQNVFEIKDAGVSINIMIRRSKKKKGKLANVYYADLFGKQDKKYQFRMSL